MAAVQDAAAMMLAEQGPREVTMRKVAERAGVNHALIHRHFGTKEALIRVVVTEQSRQLAEQAAALPRTDPTALLALLREHGAYWRILARVVLDEPAVLGDGRLPAAAASLALIAGGEQDADEQTRVGAAVAASTALGWLVFGPHLTNALEVTDREAYDAQIGETVRRAIPRRARTLATTAIPGRGARVDPAG